MRRVLATALATLAATVGILAVTQGTAHAATAKKGPKHPVDLRVPYDTNDPLQFSDIYPSATAGSPLVVLLHGTGWTSDDETYDAGQAKNLQTAGYTVFVANYRSDSPSVAAYPYEVDDVVDATNWAMAHASTYHADPSRLILIGGSAGSNLASLATEELNDAAPNTVKALINLSGSQDWTLFDGTDLGRSQALGCDPCTTAWYTEWSPALQVTSSNCPGIWLSFNSTKEKTPLSQAESLDSHVLAAGCSHTLIVRPGNAHAYAYWNAEQDTILAAIGAV